MKLTAVILLSFCLSASAGGYGQKITLSFKEARLDKVFATLKQQSGYSFIYVQQQIDQSRPVTVELTDVPLSDALDLIFANQPFGYTFQGKHVVLQAKEKEPAEPVKKNAEPLIQPLITISGRVNDADGNPLSGATVANKTSKATTSSNPEGHFSINAKVGDILAVSFVGYLDISVRIVQANGGVIKAVVVHSDKQSLSGTDNDNSSPNPSVSTKSNQASSAVVVSSDQQLNSNIANGGIYLIFSLLKRIEAMDEIQIIAYGTTTKRLSTGNISTVKAADIEKQPVQNPLLALQGRVPGLVVTQNSGVPGGGITVRIQGQNSIANGNDPLFVIDGVPVTSQLPPSVMGVVLGESGTAGSKGNPLSFLDMNSIESIEVLKDADATAIYGSRAANGAILITTKKGKAGRTSFDVNIQSGIGKLTRRLEMMNTRQYLDMRYEALKNDGLSVDPNRDYDLTLWDTTRYTDWQKELLGGTARYHNINTILQGGSAVVQYRISGNYNKQTTVFPGDFADEKAAVSFAITNKSLNKKFSLAFSGTYLHDKNKLPSLDLTQIAIGFAPNAPPLYNPDGTINWAPTVNGISTFLANPIIRQYQSYENSTDNLISSLTVSYALSNDVSLKASMGYNVMRSSEFIGNPLLVVPPESRSFPQQRRALYGDRRIIGWNFEPQIFYKEKIENHQVDLLAGVTFYSNTIDAASVIGYDHLSDALLRNKAAAAILQSFEPTSMAEYRYHALFGRFSYNYMNKYIINVNLRRDGSSRFGTANRFENFGSIGGAWVFTEEEFFRNVLKVIGFGKLKISYGTTGSDQIPDYSYLSLYSLQNIANLNLYQGIRGLQPSRLPNPHLQWEKTKKLNVGLDVGIFKNNLLLNVNYGMNRSSNQLLSYVLASTAGYQDLVTNFPALIENTSWEFSLTATNFKKGDFRWTSNVNLTIPANRLVKFPSIASSSYATRLVIGKPINTRRLYRFAGVNPVTGNYQFFTKNNHITIVPALEDVIYLNTNPTLYGGLENSISFRKFRLEFHFHFTKQLGQNVLLNNGMGAIPGYFSINTASSNQPVTALDRWQKPGDQSLVEKYSTTSSASFYDATISTAAFRDASFIRLKNISFSYQIPSNLKDFMSIRYATLYFQAQNLFTITKYQGLDPESQGSMTLPPLKVMTVGIQLGF